MNNCWNLPAVGDAASVSGTIKSRIRKSNQQLDAKVQHLSILNQKYEHELALFKSKIGSKTNILPQNKSIYGMKRLKKISRVDLELERLNADKTDAATQKATNKPKRRLPDHLHTIRIEHEPASTQCLWLPVTSYRRRYQ